MVTFNQNDLPYPFYKCSGNNPSRINYHEQTPRLVYECEMLELSWDIRRNQKGDWYDEAMIKEPETFRGRWRKEILDRQVGVVEREWRLTRNMVDYVLKELECYSKLRDVKTGIEHACDDYIFWSRSLIPNDLTLALRSEASKLENILDPQDPNNSNPKIIQIPKHDTAESEWATSTKFCWLPSDFYVSEDGTATLTSPYINNICPTSSTIPMDTVTSIISRFVPMWERVLGSVNQWPEGGRSVSGKSLPIGTAQRLPGAGEDCIWIGGTRGEDSIYEDDWSESEYLGWEGESQEDRRMSWLRSKILRRDGEEEVDDSERTLVDEGSNSRPDTDSEIDYYRKEFRLPDCLPPSEFRSVAEQNWRVADLRGTTLQVIVKLSNIDLTPENPSYEGGIWHVEGMLNERIVSTGIYYYDSENITGSHIAFRCCIREPKSHSRSDALCMQWLYNIDREDALVQTRGQVPINQGTCVAFPNIYQHRVSPCELADPTKAGHLKMLALLLVDPAHPILSASSVPLQRKDWVVEHVHRATMDEDEV